MKQESEGLVPFEDLVTRLAQATSLALFCDFDGTYSVQDVGSTLARRHLAEHRRELWHRFEQGEFDAWGYNVELFTGFELPASILHEFLASIDLDPGARSLQAWCSEHRASFCVLSDGFDYNLDWLQRHHGVQFDYVANHLVYGGASGDEWKISPGARNEFCNCGTGTCKRGIIAAYRKQHPGSFCVHVGNGRVSDLCGAEEADLAFAKDTLAAALQERKRSFEPFNSLHDVAAKLDTLWSETQAQRDARD